MKRGVYQILPAFLFLLIIFIIPVLFLFKRSLFDPSFTFEHFERIIKEPVYVNVLWITFKISIIVTSITIILGYPLAYSAYRLQDNWKKWLILAIVTIPFWTSLLVRTFAFMMLLQRATKEKCAITTLRLKPVFLAHSLRGQQTK